MFAKLLVSSYTILLAGVLDLGPPPNTPFLDSFHTDKPSPTDNRANYVRVDGPKVNPEDNEAADVADSVDAKPVDPSTAETSTDQEKSDGDAMPAISVPEHSAAGMIEQPQVAANDKTTPPLPEFTPGVLGSFRLRCGHRAELHLSPLDGTFHIAAMHGRTQRSYPVECVIGSRQPWGRVVLQLSNGAALWWADNRFFVVVP